MEIRTNSRTIGERTSCYGMGTKGEGTVEWYHWSEPTEATERGATVREIGRESQSPRSAVEGGTLGAGRRGTAAEPEKARGPGQKYGGGGVAWTGLTRLQELRNRDAVGPGMV
jgi:hypothetical protein